MNVADHSAAQLHARAEQLAKAVDDAEWANVEAAWHHKARPADFAGAQAQVRQFVTDLVDELDRTRIRLDLTERTPA